MYFSQEQIAQLAREYVAIDRRYTELRQAYINHSWNTERGKEFAVNGFARRLQCLYRSLRACKSDDVRILYMSKPISVQILERARALIADEQHWSLGHLARDARGYPVSPTDSEAVQWCAFGALVAAAYEFSNDRAVAHDFAASAMRPLVGGTQLTHINDIEGHAAVIALFDAVIGAH